MEKILKGSMEENSLETKEKSNSVDQSSSGKAAEKIIWLPVPALNRGSREKVRCNRGALQPGLKHDLCRGGHSSLLVSILCLMLLPVLSAGVSSAIILGFHRLVYFLKRVGQIDMCSKLVSEFCLTDTETGAFCLNMDKKSCGTQGCRQPSSIKRNSHRATLTPKKKAGRCKEPGTLCQQQA